MLYYPIVVAVLTLLSQGNLTHVTILCVVDVPEPSTQVGRVQYKLSPETLKDIKAKWPRKD
jgi:hypothetical protein